MCSIVGYVCMWFVCVCVRRMYVMYECTLHVSIRTTLYLFIKCYSLSSHLCPLTLNCAFLMGTIGGGSEGEGWDGGNTIFIKTNLLRFNR